MSAFFSDHNQITPNTKRKPWNFSILVSDLEIISKGRYCIHQTRTCMHQKIRDLGIVFYSYW